jgi:hypothetical protein
VIRPSEEQGNFWQRQNTPFPYYYQKKKRKQKSKRREKPKQTKKRKRLTSRGYCKNAKKSYNNCQKER